MKMKCKKHVSIDQCLGECTLVTCTKSSYNNLDNGDCTFVYILN